MRIANVVFDAAGATPELYARSAGGIAAMYAELLGMRLLSRADYHREAGWPADEGDALDPLVFAIDGVGPNIAFEWEKADYRAPAWPDPDHPQQVHLDVVVASMDEAHALVLRHGAALLADFGDHRVYADCIGHPFCLYPSASGPVEAPRIARVVFDCLSPRSLARFYAELLDMPVRVVDTPERVEIAAAAGGDASRLTLAFQHAVCDPPRWPDPARPQQLHLDFDAEDGPSARDLASRLGAVRLEALGGGIVYADPAGHPFCLGE